MMKEMDGHSSKDFSKVLHKAAPTWVHVKDLKPRSEERELKTYKEVIGESSVKKFEKAVPKDHAYVNVTSDDDEHESKMLAHAKKAGVHVHRIAKHHVGLHHEDPHRIYRVVNRHLGVNFERQFGVLPMKNEEVEEVLSEEHDYNDFDHPKTEKHWNKLDARHYSELDRRERRVKHFEVTNHHSSDALHKSGHGWVSSRTTHGRLTTSIDPTGKIKHEWSEK
jgi:hypothetical protein